MAPYDRGVEVYEAVTSRQSIRAFTDRPVARDALDRVLTAAARAPSAGNLQPWHVRRLRPPRRHAPLPAPSPPRRDCDLPGVNRHCRLWSCCSLQEAVRARPSRRVAGGYRLRASIAVAVSRSA
ncbi:nitroreductase family protein [Nocardia rhamnosiphila]|uniref:nitroreductase family protein n=1 Tax=Nocardia rhamnosiphila TaxID=426716 RepID=UPI001FE0E287|nr:nitroreductase family protein [Nocardia rhamnosiphila]